MCFKGQTSRNVKKVAKMFALCAWTQIAVKSLFISCELDIPESLLSPFVHIRVTLYVGCVGSVVFVGCVPYLQVHGLEL